MFSTQRSKVSTHPFSPGFFPSSTQVKGWMDEDKPIVPKFKGKTSRAKWNEEQTTHLLKALEKEANYWGNGSFYSRIAKKYFKGVKNADQVRTRVRVIAKNLKGRIPDRSKIGYIWQIQ